MGVGGGLEIRRLNKVPWIRPPDVVDPTQGEEGAVGAPGGRGVNGRALRDVFDLAQERSAHTTFTIKVCAGCAGAVPSLGVKTAPAACTVTAQGLGCSLQAVGVSSTVSCGCMVHEYSVISFLAQTTSYGIARANSSNMDLPA